MQKPESTFFQTDLTCLAVEQLPDGSTAIFDERSKSVHSLNPSATVVWRACASGATLPQIMAALADRFSGPVDAEIANHAIAQLQQSKLIESKTPEIVPVAGAVMEMGRRSILKRVGSLGAIAVPVVLTLTAAEQRGYAINTSSTTRPIPG